MCLLNLAQFIYLLSKEQIESIGYRSPMLLEVGVRADYTKRKMSIDVLYQLNTD